MKIAYLANIRFPSERAHAVQIAHMCQAFEKNGASVDLIINKRTRGGKKEIDDYFKIDSLFNLKRIPYGIFAPSIKMSYYFGEFFFVLAFLFLCKHKNYDVLYSRSEWIVWPLSFFVSSRKLVWESHEAKLNFPARRIFQKEIKVIVISEGIFKSYKKNDLESKRILIADDGIDETFFGALERKDRAQERLGIKTQDAIAMYIGGFDGWKGAETFFTASNLLPRINFVAIGGTAEQVSRFSKKYPSVKFLGQRPYSEIRHNQQAADVLIVPNSGKTELSSEYTSPLKLFAHMASGVPLIISDIPSLVTVAGRDLVTVVQPDSSESLAKGIEVVFAHYEAKKMSAQELRSISMMYTWTNRAKKILSFLEEKPQ